MSVLDKFDVRPIRNKESYSWLMNIHYAKRIPSISYAFGLFDKNQKRMVGVITYGQGSNYVEAGMWDNSFLELNRLVTEEGLGKNVLSYFVSSSISMLPKNIVIISYADIDNGHHGYIYQATNWVYTGIGAVGTKRFILKDGTEKPQRGNHLIEKNKIDKILKGTGKHRYYYFVGDKKFKREMLKKLKGRFEILPYPKGQNNRYIINDNISKQKTLF